MFDTRVYCRVYKELEEASGMMAVILADNLLGLEIGLGFHRLKAANTFGISAWIRIKPSPNSS